MAVLAAMAVLAEMAVMTVMALLAIMEIPTVLSVVKVRPVLTVLSITVAVHEVVAEATLMTKLGNNMAPLALIVNLATRWRHLTFSH